MPCVRLGHCVACLSDLSRDFSHFFVSLDPCMHATVESTRDFPLIINSGGGHEQSHDASMVPHLIILFWEICLQVLGFFHCFKTLMFPLVLKYSPVPFFFPRGSPASYHVFK